MTRRAPGRGVGRGVGRDTAARQDAGAVPVEAALLLPVVLAFVLIVIAAGRVQSTGAVVDSAARAGARAASLAGEASARDAAENAVRDLLGRREVHCTHDPTTGVGFGTVPSPGGGLDTVTVRVSCTVPLSDLLGVNGLGGQKTMTGEFTSVVDRYRGE